MGEVTVITSGKGGAGKSTVTAGLGAALAMRGRRVLLLDGDAGLRTLDILLGVSRSLVFDISDVVNGNCPLVKAIYPCADVNGLFLLPAPQSEEDVVSPQVMKQLVSVLLRYYDHILIDCPAGMGRGFHAAVAAAHRAVVVATADAVCLRDCSKVRLALQQNDIDRLHLVINRFNAKNFYKAAVYEDLDAVIDAAGMQLLGVIEEESRITAAGGLLDYRSLPRVFHRLAARLEGETVPLLIKT